MFKTLSKFTNKSDERGSKHIHVNENIKEVDESLSSYNIDNQQYGQYQQSKPNRNVLSQSINLKKGDRRKRPYTDIELSGTEDEVTIGEKVNETMVMPSSYSKNPSRFKPTQKSVSH